MTVQDQRRRPDTAARKMAMVAAARDGRQLQSCALEPSSHAPSRTAPTAAWPRAKRVMVAGWNDGKQPRKLRPRATSHAPIESAGGGRAWTAATPRAPATHQRATTTTATDARQPGVIFYKVVTPPRLGRPVRLPRPRRGVHKPTTCMHVTCCRFQALQQVTTPACFAWRRSRPKEH